MEIRKATLADFDSLFKIILDCKEDMKVKGVEQWPSHHPSKETIQNGIESNCHYVLIDGGKIVGGVLLNHACDDQYKLVKWRVEDKNPLMVHRLAVSPKLQGKGYAKKLMEFAEEFAKKEGSKSIRLDTYKLNSVSNKFYEKLGYKLVGTIKMPQYMPGEYNCYEKVLD
jgi:GNAT superfamily N-acetyltransferase